MTAKEPKPTSFTFWFFLSEAPMVPSKLLRVSLARCALQPVVFWISPIRCFLSLVPDGVAV